MNLVAAIPASTVVLLRAARPFEIFLVRRSDSIAFMGGAHVFPGGRVDDADQIDDLDLAAAGLPRAVERMRDVPVRIAVAQYVADARIAGEKAFAGLEDVRWSQPPRAT